MNLRGNEVSVAKRYEIMDNRKYSYRIFGDNNTPVLIVGSNYDEEIIDSSIFCISTPYNHMGYVFSNVVIPGLIKNKCYELTEDEINEIVNILSEG